MSIASNLNNLKLNLPKEVSLVAVSKTKPNSAIQEAYDAGHRVFGENKIQELAQKYADLPKDIQWHMIGHVQTNKIKYIAPFVSLVHGCDREKVLKELQKQALKNNRVIDCLIQVHIAEEDTKFGYSEAEVNTFLNEKSWEKYPNLRFRGMMGMATNTPDQDQVKKEFTRLHHLFESFKSQSELSNWDTLSMGMSNDFSLAISCGSNMIRVGSAIFGARNYA